MGKAATELEQATEQKIELTTAIATDLTALMSESSSTPAGKKALKATIDIGKMHGFDQTLLQSFPFACKKDAALRTDFDAKLFTMMTDALNKQVGVCSQKMVELEADKEQTSSAIEEVRKELSTAEEFLNSVEDEVKDAKANVKEVEADLRKATASRAEIWTDMKEACLAADTIAAELRKLNETVMPLFLKLREKEPESKPVEEPVVEEP